MKNFILYRILFYGILTFIGLQPITAQIAYKQIRLPLDTLKGVPYSIEPEMKEYIIDGFEVDSEENFYFCSGNSTNTLACYDGEKFIYNKRIPQAKGAVGIFIHNDTLYLVSYYNLKPFCWALDFHAFSPKEAIPLYTFPSDTCHKASLLVLNDSLIIDEVYDSKGDYFEIFNFKGEKQKNTDNPYHFPPQLEKLWEMSLDPRLSREEYKKHAFYRNYKGRYKDFYVFSDTEAKASVFLLTDRTGKIINSQIIPDSLTQLPPYYSWGSPEMQRILRNDKLYILGIDKKTKEILITRIDLKDLEP